MEHNIIIKADKTYQFFHQEGKGIAYREAGKPEYELLFPGGYYDFDCIKDGYDNIHLVCQDDEGTISYLSYAKGEWRRLPLLESRDKTAYPKYFRLMLVNGHLSLFYAIMHNGSKMLVHQLLDNPDAIPTVLDYVSGTARPYWVVKTFENDLLCYYTNSQQQLMEIRYAWKNKTWGAPQEIETNGDAALAPFAVTSGATIHLCYLCRNEKYYSVYYQRFNHQWSGQKNLFFDCGEGVLPYITLGESLYVWWTMEQKPIIFEHGANEPWKRASQLEISCMRFPGRAPVKVDASYSYGCCNKEGVTLFICPDLLKDRPRPKRQATTAQKEIETFAAQGLAPANAAAPQAEQPPQGPPVLAASAAPPAQNAAISAEKIKIIIDMYRADMQKELGGLKAEISRLKEQVAQLENN